MHFRTCCATSRLRLCLVLAASLLCAGAASAAPICPPFTPCVLDFETDDGGNPLVNGQSISTAPDVQDGKGNPDTVFEFGHLVDISTRRLGSDGHEGAAIFDSTPGGPNSGGPDPDLLVDKGNLLILQNDAHPSTTLDPVFGLVFDTPNDEADASDAGSIVFDFLVPNVELVSIDLVDINGGNQVKVILTDAGGNQRIYAVPSEWTGDITDGFQGFETLRLDTLDDQPGPGGSTATLFRNDPGFDALDVAQLEVQFGGSPVSSGLDNLVFVPEPSPALLLGMGLVGLAAAGRRISR